jgi:hypothetical protein
MLALDPQLIFARSVASVLAAFKHRDDHDFDRDWRGRMSPLRSLRAEPGSMYARGGK